MTLLEDAAILTRAIEGGAIDALIYRDEDGSIDQWWPGYARDLNAWAASVLGREFLVYGEDYKEEAREEVREISLAIGQRFAERRAS